MSDLLCTGEVHPIADLFPMMTDDELNALAEDIKANGLVHPIVVDANGILIDGRNRMEGCRRAGVDPTFMALNGADPVAFIMSSNVSRRHLSKGQQAAVVAYAIKTAKFAVLIEDVARMYGISERYLGMANVMLEYAEELFYTLMAGAITLSDAYDKAREIKEGRETEEDRFNREQAEVQEKFSRLQSGCPELAVKVQEGELTLAGALAEWEERQRQEREHISAVTKALDAGLSFLDPCGWDKDEHAREWLKADAIRLGESADFSADRARRVADVLLRYAKLKEMEENG